MGSILQKDSAAPAFALKNKAGKTVRLSDFKGKWVILYFYPKDDTPGCTQEAIDFTGLLSKFGKQDSVILGISPDSEDSHAAFSKKHDLAVELLSDPDHQTLEAYGVWGEKNLYGKKSMGVIRTTFLIDNQGIIRDIWNKVKVDGHAENVLNSVCALRREKSA